MMIFFSEKSFLLGSFPREYFSTCLKVLQYFLGSTEMG